MHKIPESAVDCRPPLLGMSFAQLEALCAQAGVKPAHAETLRAHIFRHADQDIRGIAGLPQAFYDYIESNTRRLEPELRARQDSEDGTCKMLLGMADGREVETVLIPGKGRLTQCISTQVGCAVACTFCLTATAGLTRNLSAAEMVGQIHAAFQHTGLKPRNLVLMGMGEPLHNYDEVARFIRLATDPKGMAFSPRRVTISTAGHVPGIERMIEDDLPCNLALSLNASNDETRSAIMPINRRWPIAEVLKWTSRFAAGKKKRILIEYVMLAGINDSDADAHRLVELLADLPCTVNLLPFNALAGNDFRRPDDARVSAFREILVRADRVAVVRESRGRDISAACGQLRTEVQASRRQKPTKIAEQSANPSPV
ncbi:MAG: 23S rRNA (adenine(2503)-C(2))-methyltransferase RlmN [Zetaproteobacteria bacterium CG06_land_8_20_14_3_00_59_53]|nr:MAG: 23S rRNA (adenine(2503)-C(2))-methyltransferase [Zetaproteobacteria bacterium CG2_30_59_37]PIO89656.1 MAG: 23S rRNA (adenine(2503)-C(2))-methyltransferase RlmN [Zetaproteobacteria bacterium CG23_combo_of_CG06-09_8_20_14_all_59_86]PIU71343.1 MAG: 23S rRNA (adenine(2503)-C(2))-methyltransferase RlmN [Zetaproteobacteria bacterium CG06_land_8_20_14_3_00_59_53]PIU97601.1 MAG: 23S rRNA (adenine(2503)-C(2))-methyltransferase RlmN [Zetaproteobacteria bacterium CG03_land_8_20_14_0_80_59_51]PIY47